MQLIVAEKPSVAREIAKVIGANKKEDGYFYNENFYVSWCIGHLVESAMPEDYNEVYKEWRLDNLPFIPNDWKTIVSAKTKSQYEVVEQLINKEEVDSIICATDAGREGELIFRLVYNQTKTNKPFKRLWISSMEEESIRKGLQNMKDGREYDNLYYSALSRMKADYIVGINATRLYSCMYNQKLTIGRVQTPTINLIVKRQKEIENFISTPYYNLIADCKKFKALLKVDDKDKANAIVKKCHTKNGTIKRIEEEEKKENAQPLYDLTSLQREANKLLGYTAQETLDIAQKLYEDKLITYPRTDSKYITEDMKESTKELIGELSKSILDYNIEHINMEKIINNKKVTDHHAILPTKRANQIKEKELSENEKNILQLIIYRLLMSVYLPKVYLYTKIEVDIEGEVFKATGNKVLQEGYTSIEKDLKQKIKAKEEKKEEEVENKDISSDIKEGDTINNIQVISIEKKTKPLSPYTEASLLSAMENVGRYIEDNELKEAMKGGLGTPATRAGIIEKIIKTGYIERKGKHLYPTKLALTLMEILPEKLKEPEMTAEWEKNLEAIYEGEMHSSDFLGGIKQYMSDVVTEAKENYNPEIEKSINVREVIGTCPRCGNEVTERPKSYSCEKCNFAIWKEDKFFKEKKKRLTKTQVKKLLTDGKVSIKGLYSPKKDSTYDAIVVLEDTGKYVNFKLEF